MTNEGKLLLVPKSIVRRALTYSHNEYFRHYILEHLRSVELAANSELVQLLKNGTRRVTNKALIAKYGQGKATAVDITLEFPELLQRYRLDKSTRIKPLLGHGDLAHDEGSPPPNWNALSQAVRDILPGLQGAGAYERAIEALLTALFYPALSYPEVQFPLHDGRKRVDIKYTNTDQSGFFRWLGQHYPAAHIFVECKNYTGEVANQELDQLSGRFSPTRGQIGILVCRNFDNKELFVERCRDTAQDRRGFVIPLDDDDLVALIDEVEDAAAGAVPTFPLLRERFQRLVM